MTTASGHLKSASNGEERALAAIALVATAGVLTREQLFRLLPWGKCLSAVHRFVREQVEAGHLRSEKFQDGLVSGSAVFATRKGWSLVAEHLPALGEFRQRRPSPSTRHDLIVTELFVQFAMVRRPANPFALRFEWVAEGLEYRVKSLGGADHTVRPDAQLIVPANGRHAFIEAESGAHTVAEVVAKLDGYDLLFALPGLEFRRTEYECRFPRGRTPEVAFIVESTGTRDKIRAAIDARRPSTGCGPNPIKARCWTIAEYVARLMPELSEGEPVATRPPVEVPFHEFRTMAQVQVELADRHLLLQRRALMRWNEAGCPPDRKPTLVPDWIKEARDRAAAWIEQLDRPGLLGRSRARDATGVATGAGPIPAARGDQLRLS